MLLKTNNKTGLPVSFSPKNSISITSEIKQEHNLSVIPHQNIAFEVDSTFPTIIEKNGSIESPYLPPVRWQVVGLIVVLRFGAKYCVDALNLLQTQVVESMEISYT